LTRQKKYSLKGVVRTVSPATTIRRARKILLKAGISRVAEVTHLDRIGIPNFMSVRPREIEPGISYYNGKGTTQDDAHAGAIMEAIERHAGEACESEIVFGSYSQLRRSRRCVDPEEIVVPRLKDYSSALPLEWVLAKRSFRSTR
jgi:YcaO-like protein with predicted kinase domain